MTIISSGQLALQNAGTNPNTTVDNAVLNTSFTAHVDGLLQIKQLYEAGDGYYLPATAWQGDVFGFINSIFSSYYIHNVYPILVGGGIGNRSYSSQSNIGSLGATTYSDTAGTSTVRTIKGLTWGIPDSGSTEKLFIFALSGTSIANSDTTFSKIEITTSGGTTVTINRSDLSYDASENGHTFWYWSGTSGTMNTNVTNLGQPNSSSYTLKVYSGTVTISLNNGIAEEMGGADSSNVKMSDYYSNGAFMGNVTGISTSGQLKMSDFLGKTFVGQIFDHTTTLLPDYWAFASGSYITQYFTGFMEGDGTYSGSGDSLGDATFPNTGTITFGGLTRNANDVEITSAYFTSVNNASTSTSFSMILKDYSSDRGTSWTGTGFTNLEIYLDQSNTTGTPDLTLALADATATYSSQSTYTQILLHWAAADGGQQNYSNYFGTSGTPATNGTQTLNITGLS